MDTKVFVAGATGVVGRRVVARLLAAGADVTGVGRNDRRLAELRTLGAAPAEVDLFDPDAVAQAVAGHDVVCNLATAIPTGERAADPAAWDMTKRLRREGSRNLVDAALATGASRYVQESLILLYADGGDDVLDEDAPLDPTAITAAALDAEAQAERFAAGGGAGVALRFGLFYGFDSAHSVEAMEATLAGRPHELGPADSYRPSVTTDDAAAAVVAAFGAPSGVYNVADRPVRRGEFVDALARALGVPTAEPPTIVPDLPPEHRTMLRSLRASSDRLTEATGWRPRVASAREGWPFVVAELRRHADRQERPAS
jgi:2-alkyl-3-oxoalkanoate reductase